MVVEPCGHLFWYDMRAENKRMGLSLILTQTSQQSPTQQVPKCLTRAWPVTAQHHASSQVGLHVHLEKG